MKIVFLIRTNEIILTNEIRFAVTNEPFIEQRETAAEMHIVSLNKCTMLFFK